MKAKIMMLMSIFKNKSMSLSIRGAYIKKSGIINSQNNDYEHHT